MHFSLKNSRLALSQRIMPCSQQLTSFSYPPADPFSPGLRAASKGGPTRLPKSNLLFSKRLRLHCKPFSAAPGRQKKIYFFERPDPFPPPLRADHADILQTPARRGLPSANRRRAAHFPAPFQMPLTRRPDFGYGHYCCKTAFKKMGLRPERQRDYGDFSPY